MLRHGQRPRLAGAGEHERELLAAEPRRHIPVATGGAEHVGEAPQHVVTRVVAERVVDALEVVEVDHEQRQLTARAERVEVGVDPRLEAAAVAQARERVVGGEVAQAVELARRLDRAHRLVRERAQRLQLSVAGQQAVLGVVDPDHAEEPAVAVVHHHEEPVVVPGARPAAVVDRGVDVVHGGRRAALGLGGVHHDAAVGQEGGVEQRRQRVERDRREARDLLGGEADAGERREVPAGVVGEEDHHLLEAERLTDAVADGIEHLLRRVAPRELRGDAQEVLDGGAVAAALGGALGLLEGDGDVRGDGAEQLELDLGGAAAGEGLVDRHDAEHLAGR